MDFEIRYSEYKKAIESYLEQLPIDQQPHSLYDPIHYIISAGGKRIRPMLTLLSCEAAGGSFRQAVYAGVAIELLHTFTLVHDDIMDNADSRRCIPTIHRKWDNNVAILAGDALLCIAYRTLLCTKSSNIQKIASLFTEGVLVVCEGQAYDKDFEIRKRVRVSEYMMMIAKKTAKLIAVSTEIGALIGEGNTKSVNALREYGLLIGRAFQIQDDLLDVFAEDKKFGKNLGGDLQEGKKTFLLLEGLRRAKGKDKLLLENVIKNKGVSRKQINLYRKIYEETGTLEAARKQIAKDTENAKKQLSLLPSSDARSMLFWFTDILMNRTY